MKIAFILLISAIYSQIAISFPVFIDQADKEIRMIAENYSLIEDSKTFYNSEKKTFYWFPKYIVSLNWAASGFRRGLLHSKTDVLYTEKRINSSKSEFEVYLSNNVKNLTYQKLVQYELIDDLLADQHTIEDLRCEEEPQIINIPQNFVQNVSVSKVDLDFHSSKEEFVYQIFGHGAKPTPKLFIYTLKFETNRPSKVKQILDNNGLKGNLIYKCTGYSKDMDIEGEATTIRHSIPIQAFKER